MHKNAKKFNRKKIVASLAGVLACAVVGSAIYSSSTEALAKASLPGIEKIVMSNSNALPFYVLEIVPDYKDASMGYLVAGEEPIDNTNAQSQSDMAYLDEVKDRISATTGYSSQFTSYDDLVDKAFEYEGPVTDGDDKTYSSYGMFKENDLGTGYYSKKSEDLIYGIVHDSATAYANTMGYNAAGVVYDPSDEDTRNATIEEVYNRDKDGTDKTGIFYLDFVYYVADDLGAPQNTEYLLNLNAYITASEDHSKDAPFKLYDRTLNYNHGTPADTSDDYSTTQNFYNDQLFVVDTILNFDEDENDSTKRVYNGGFEDGIVIYSRMGDSLAPWGVFKTISDVQTVVMYDTTAPNDERIFADLNDFATVAYDASLDLVTIRSHSSEDYSTMYYISSVDELTDVTTTHSNLAGIGRKISLSEKVQINDPSSSYTLEDYGIVAGDTKHDYFYKLDVENPFVYVSAHDGDRDFVHTYSGEKIQTYTYSKGFKNNEWLKTAVFDREVSQCDSMTIDVVTKKISEVTVEDIANAGLVYISGGEYYATPGDYTTGDFEEAVAVYLLQKLCDEHDPKPVAMDYSALSKIMDDGDGKTYESNFGKFVAVLIASSVNGGELNSISAYANFDGTKWADAYTLDVAKSFEKKVKDITTLRGYVNGDFYLNNDDSTGKKIVASDFSTEITDPAEASGFTAVVSNIKDEAFYLKVNNNQSDFNKALSKATILRYIIGYGDKRVTTKPSLRVLDIEPYYAPIDEGHSKDGRDNPIYDYLRYVNNGRDQKNEVSNPLTDRDIFTKSWFISSIATQYEGKEDQIKVDGVGTHEFIGQVKDLNSNYDLIYIGLDTSYLNTEYNTTTKEKSTNTVYNDTALNGLVYTHTGDKYKANGNDWFASSDYRLSNNDITRDKLRELEEFVKAGYAVILSDECVMLKDGRLVPNNKKIESSSYMYEFIRFCLNGEVGSNTGGYYGKNVYLKKDFDSKKVPVNVALTNKDTFVNYLNISKLEIELIEKPVDYYSFNEETEKEDYKYIEKTGALYMLDYKVKLKNNAAVDTTNTTYDCKLYIDGDADGRFEEKEILGGLDIVEVYADGSTSSSFSLNHDKYELQAGHTYYISRRVPENYVGFLAWKLEFIENNANTTNVESVIRNSEVGYCAVPDYQRKPEIEILQLTSANSKNTTLDLASDEMNDLYKQVYDFKINIKQETCDNFVNKKGIFEGCTNYEDVLNKYDMIVMGFLDSYEFTNVGEDDADGASRNAVLALREYILSGRSMLFTHDLNSPLVGADKEKAKSWGRWANNYLRDLQGMDRFGIVRSKVNGVTYNGKSVAYTSKYDSLIGFGGQENDSVLSDLTVAFNNATLYRWHNGSNQYGELAATGAGNTTEGNRTLTKNTGNAPWSPLNFLTMRDDRSGNFYSEANEYTATEVVRVNEGQITQYPYHIDETIQVALTHPQYFQLNLDTDCTDDNDDDDIVVWYCLSNMGNAKQKIKDGNTININKYEHMYYLLDYNDVRNNYYIYNKGNITYTGAGHVDVDTLSNGNLAEAKLFVNTLVSAYNAGTHAPEVVYKQNLTKNSVDINSMYVPYDMSLAIENNMIDGWVEEKMAVNDKNEPTIDVNFKAVCLDLAKSNEKIMAEYYVTVPTITQAQKNDPLYSLIDGQWVKKISPYSFKEIDTATGEEIAGANSAELENQSTYTMKFLIKDLLGSYDVNAAYNVSIYVRTKNIAAKGTTSGFEYYKNEADKKSALPADEAKSELKINFTKLYDLK